MRQLKIDQETLIPVSNISKTEIKFIHNFFIDGETLINENNDIEINILKYIGDNKYSYKLSKGIFNINKIEKIKFRVKI